MENQQLEESRKSFNPVQDQSCGKSTSATKYVPIHPLPKPKIIYHMKLLVAQFQPSRSSLDGPWIDIYIKGLQNTSYTCDKHMYTTHLEVGAFVDIKISVK